MSAAFTPGPWQAFPMEKHALKGFVVDTALGNNADNDYVIADMIFGANAEANANLIAASPDLYEALLDMLMTDDGDLPKSHVTAVERAKSALAKARGEQSL